MKLSLYYPAQPYVVTQRWGTWDPATYAQFGMNRHGGEDCAHGYNSRLRSPFAFSFYRTLWQPNGGGLVLSIISKEQYDAPDGKPAYVCLDFMHLSKILKDSGSGDTGELIAIAGNTGFSTGPHTHLQFRWVRQKNAKWVDVEKNDANNSFDPHPFWNGLYAVDYKKPVFVSAEPNIEFDMKPVLSAAKVSLEGISEVPEPSRSSIIDLWKAVLDSLSKLLTKG